MTEPEHHPVPESAVADRLGRLGRRPLDTHRLEQRLKAALAGDTADGVADAPAVPSDTPSQAHPASRGPLRRESGCRSVWIRPMMGCAATLALAAGLLFAVAAYMPTASAAPLRLTELHRQAEAGAVALPTAASMHAVNQALREQRAGRRVLPAALQHATVQSCCLVGVQGDLVGMAVLNGDAAGAPPLSLVVARAADFAHPMGERFEVDGRSFFGHKLDGVPMVMANRGDRWLCVMGERSYVDLARIAADAEF